MWGVTKNGRSVPMDPPEKRYVKVGESFTSEPNVVIQETWLSHFATCPDPDLHRK